MIHPLPFPPQLGRATVEVCDHQFGALWHLMVVGPLPIDQTAVIYHAPGESRESCRARAVKSAAEYLKEIQ